MNKNSKVLNNAVSEQPVASNPNTYLGCTITPMKQYQGESVGKKIVVSTCFFQSDTFDISGKTCNYFNELMRNNMLKLTFATTNLN